MFLSIVIPQYNESENLKTGILARINTYMAQQKFEWEVIVVDDGSTDNSYDISSKYIKQLQNFSLIRAVHGGKPNALLQGIKHANGEYTLLMDMDQSTPIDELEKLLPYIGKYEAIIGSRGKVRNQATLLRKLAGYIFGTYRKILILGEISDTQCGFKLFKTQILKRLFPQLSALNKTNVKGWSVSAFDVELLFMFKKTGYKIKEVFVEWHDQDISVTKDRKFILESLDMVKQILLIQYNNLKGKYRQLA